MLLSLPDELITHVLWHASPLLVGAAASSRYLAELVRVMIAMPRWRRRLCNAKVLLRAGEWSGGARWSRTPRNIDACETENDDAEVINMLDASPQFMLYSVGHNNLNVWHRSWPLGSQQEPCDLLSTSSGLHQTVYHVKHLALRGTRVAVILSSYETPGALRVYDLAALTSPDIVHVEPELHVPEQGSLLRLSHYLGWVSDTEVITVGFHAPPESSLYLHLFDVSLAASLLGRPSQRLQRALLHDVEIPQGVYYAACENPIESPIYARCSAATGDGIIVLGGYTLSLWRVEDGTISDAARILDNVTDDVLGPEQDPDYAPPEAAGWFLLSNIHAGFIAVLDHARETIKVWDVRGQGTLTHTLRLPPSAILPALHKRFA